MTAPHQKSEGRIRELEGNWAPPGARHVELVFRSVGERTSDLALELALRHVKPQRAYVIEDVKPFALAVSRMLELPHVAEGSDCSHVVHMDADCLILEDMRPFLDANELPYVDCYVLDRFRGRIHCGVHITRADVVRGMAAIPVPDNDLAYVLRPESRLRNLALSQLGFDKQLKSFHILHDHFQSYEDIFAKYALRELRSRTEFQRKRLSASMARWGTGTDLDVARHAVAHAAGMVPESAKPKHVDAYIRHLPFTAMQELAKLGLADQPDLRFDEVQQALEVDATLSPSRPRVKVFGIGLSRTGARSLTAALHVLGLDTVHDPVDAATLATLERGDARFPLLDHYDGITDLAAVATFRDLDRLHPDAKFVLTIRDESHWLDSCARHFAEHDVWETSDGAEQRTHVAVRERLMRAVYGTTQFDSTVFLRAYRAHVEAVLAHFAGRPDKLLVLDIEGGEGWEKLAPFFRLDIPSHPFPHKGKKLPERAASLEIDD